MKKSVIIILAVICCSCVRQSKFDDLIVQYETLKEELKELKTEKTDIELTLASHNIQLEDLEDKLNRYELLLRCAREEITKSKSDLENAKYWYDLGSSFHFKSYFEDAYSGLSLEETILVNNGY